MEGVVSVCGSAGAAGKLPLGIRAVERCLRRRKDSDKAKTGYQIFIFCLTFWIYAVYTLTRRPFTVVKIALCPPCANESALDKLESALNNDNLSAVDNLEGWPPFNSINGKTLLGAVDYSLIFAYAIGLFISGYVADRMNLRYFLTGGMIGSGVAALLLGFGFFFQVHHLAYFIVFQILAGFMQSTGWPGLLGVTAKWYGKKNRGKIMALWGSCSFVGSILGYGIPSSILTDPPEDSPWGWAFIIPACIIFSTAALAFFFLVTDPAHLGFKAAIQSQEQEEKCQYEQEEIKVEDMPRKEAGVVEPAGTADVLEDKLKQENEEELKVQSIPHKENVSPNPKKFGLKSVLLGNTESNRVGFFRALLIPGVVEFSLAFFFNKLVVYAFNFWLPFYVAVSLPVGGRIAAWIAGLFDIGGIIGGLSIGALSDMLGSRSLIIVPTMLVSVPLVYLIRSFGGTSLLVYCFLLLLIGCTVNGPHIIITGAVANDLGTHKSLREDQVAKSIVAGIVDGTGSIGSALGPLLVGVLSDRFDWDAVFYLLMASICISALCLSRLVLSDSKKLCSNLRLKTMKSDGVKPLAGRENKTDIPMRDRILEATNKNFDEVSTL